MLADELEQKYRIICCHCIVNTAPTHELSIRFDVKLVLTVLTIEETTHAFIQ